MRVPFVIGIAELFSMLALSFCHSGASGKPSPEDLVRWRTKVVPVQRLATEWIELRVPHYLGSVAPDLAAFLFPIVRCVPLDIYFFSAPNMRCLGYVPTRR